MKIVKWCLVFAGGFAVSWILIFTFTQEPFKAVAPAKVFWYDTPEFPMYAYVATTFGIGLAIGFFAAAYYYIAGQAGIRNKKKEIRRLEEVIKEKDAELERLRAAAAQVQKKVTESFKAVAEKDLPI